MNHPESWKGLCKFLAKESLIDVLRLIRSENIGPVTFFNLVRQFGAAKAALEAIPDLAAKMAASYILQGVLDILSQEKNMHELV